MDVERSNLSDISTTRLNLRSINLNNFATFNDQTITFTNHFNSIIGETGSGKSLILDALNSFSVLDLIEGSLEKDPIIQLLRHHLSAMIKKL